MINNKTITAIDIDSKENIYYIKLKNKNGLEILVYDNQELLGEFFEFKVIQKGNILKVQNMFAHDKKYRKKGLPEVLIEYAKIHFQESIYSSAIVRIGNDWLSEEGKKVWARLLTSGGAYFDESLGRYKTT